MHPFRNHANCIAGYHAQGRFQSDCAHILGFAFRRWTQTSWRQGWAAHELQAHNSFLKAVNPVRHWSTSHGGKKLGEVVALKPGMLWWQLCVSVLLKHVVAAMTDGAHEGFVGVPLQGAAFCAQQSGEAHPWLHTPGAQWAPLTLGGETVVLSLWGGLQQLVKKWQLPTQQLQQWGPPVYAAFLPTQVVEDAKGLGTLQQLLPGAGGDEASDGDNSEDGEAAEPAPLPPPERMLPLPGWGADPPCKGVAPVPPQWGDSHFWAAFAALLLHSEWGAHNLAVLNLSVGQLEVAVDSLGGPKPNRTLKALLQWWRHMRWRPWQQAYHDAFKGSAHKDALSTPQQVMKAAKTDDTLKSLVNQFVRSTSERERESAAMRLPDDWEEELKRLRKEKRKEKKEERAAGGGGQQEEEEEERGGRSKGITWGGQQH